MKTTRWAVIALGFAFVCSLTVLSFARTPDPPAPPAVAGDESEFGTLLPTRDAKLVTTDKGLVQLLIYGTAAFNFNDDWRDTSLTSAEIFMPVVPLHTVRLEKGTFDSRTYVWKPIEYDTSNRPFRLAGRSLEFERPAPPSLSAPRKSPYPLPEYPANSSEAEDARWMLSSQNFAPGMRLKSGYSGTKFVINGGNLATCGLVHSNTLTQVCGVNLAASTFRRSASEYMIVQFEVPSDTTEVILKATSAAGTIQRVSIPERGGTAPAQFNGIEYKKVFDISLTNYTVMSTRPNYSDHAKMLASLFQNVPPSLNWKISTSTCASLSSPVQSACLDYYDRYYDIGSPGGANRPICPFVGDP